MTEPVDLDALETFIAEREVYSGFEAEDRAWDGFKAAIAELRELRRLLKEDDEAAEGLAQNAIFYIDNKAELERLRAWKALLGPPETWFPSLPEGPRTGENTATWSWRIMGEAVDLYSRAKETEK